MIRGACEALERMRAQPSLAVVIAEAFLARLGFSVITFALPFYALSLGMSLGETGLLISLRIMTSVLLKPVMGLAADRYGIKNVYVASIGGRGIIALLFMLATEPWHLFLVRALQGITSAAREPTSAVMLMQNADPNRMAATFSWYATSRSIGIGMGYPLAGALLAWTGDNYPLVFLFTAATAAIAFVLVWSFAADAAAVPSARDGMADEPGLAPGSAEDWLSFAALALLMAIPASMVQSLFPLIVAERTGLGKAEIGIIYTLSMGVVIVAGPLLGWVSDTISRRFVFAVRSVASVLSSVLYCVLPGLSGMTAARMVDDVGSAAFKPAWGSVMGDVARYAGKQRRGRIVSYLDTAESLGEAIGPILAGLIWQNSGILWLFGARIALTLVAEIQAIRALGGARDAQA